MSHNDYSGVSIVVPVFNGEAYISRCVESLLELDYPEEKREIIIVDNRSTDDTKNIIQKYPVRYLFEGKKGACCARNTGWKTATFDLIAFTDCDCVADKNWLKEIVIGFDDEMVGGCGGYLKPAPPKTVIEEYVIYKDILSQERAMRNESLSPPFIVTANAMYRKKILEEAGGFDETFIAAGEDADLSWRVAWKGYKILYEPNAIVNHYHRATLMGLLRQIRSYGAGGSYLFHKHHEKLGYKRYVSHQVYNELILSFIKIPYCLAFGKNRLERIVSILDFLGAFSYLSGKISASLKIGARFY